MNIPVIGSKWKHHNGNEYIVYDITNEHAEPERREEYPVTVSYIGSNGKKWSKPLDNFLDRMRPSDGEWGTVPVLKSTTLHDPATKQKPSMPVIVEQECDANTPKFPPLKINVTTNASLKQSEGLWYYVNANDVFVDQTAEVIRSVLVEVGGALAGAKTDAALSRAKLDWKRPQPAAMRDQIAANGMNYVGPVSIHGPVIWGNRTARGGVLPDLVFVATVLHEVSKYARNHSDKGSGFDLSFWFALQQRAADVTRHFVEAHMLSPAAARFFWAESRNCVLHLIFPMSAISGSQDQSFEVEVLMDKGEFRINMDETVASRIDEVVSLDWILMG